MSQAKKPAAHNASALAALAYVGIIADTMVTVAQAPELIQVEVDKIRKLKIKMGTVKQLCALALKFQSTFDAAKTKAGKPLSPATRDNYLSFVRKAINEGTKFSFNPYLAASRAKAKATKPAARPEDTSATPTPTPTATPSTPTATPTTPTAAPSTPTAPASVPTLSVVKPNSISKPADAQREIGRALCAVRAACTQETWNQVLVLNPALAKLVDMWGDTWAIPAKPVATKPVATKPTTKARKAA
jgi:hypothetical protein